MKKSILTVIAAVAALLVISSIGYSYDVVDVQVSSYMCGDASEYGIYGHSIFKDAQTVARAWIYGGDDQQYAYSYAQEMRSLTIVDYDPQVDPTLTARMNGYTSAHSYAWGYLESSNYCVGAESATFINSSCYSSIWINLYSPDEEDHGVDNYVEYEDVSYNNATIDYGHKSGSWVFLAPYSYMQGYTFSAAAVIVTIEED